MERKVDVAIIGSGTSGLNAMGQTRRAGKSFVLINGGELGTTCARVGCMPSKVLIQVAEDFARRKIFHRFGIKGEESLSLDDAHAMEHVQDTRDIFVDRVLAGSTDEMGDELIEGYAEFVDEQTLKVNDQIIKAEKIVLATGSTPIIPAAWQQFGDRILTSDSVFEIERLPKSVAVIGLGVIGLELGQALYKLDVEVTGIDQLEIIAGLTDPVANQSAVDAIGKEFSLWLGSVAEISEEGDLLRVSAGDDSVLVEKVLVSIGRRPNLDKLGLEKLDIELDAAGIPVYNPNTMQVGNSPIFIAGDMDGVRPILHEAGDEGKIAGYNASHDEVKAFKRKTPLGITFTEPNIVTAGETWSELQERDDVVTAQMPMGPVGRALIMAKNKGVIRVYAEKSSGRILGAAIVSTKGEHLGHLLSWSIEQGLTVHDLLQMPFYHPTIEEGLQAALYNLLKEVDAKPSPLLELQELSS